MERLLQKAGLTIGRFAGDAVAMRVCVAILLSLALISCAKRGDFIELSQLPEEKAVLAADIGISEPIFVGTSRLPEQGQFGFERSRVTHYLRYDILLPPEHKIGEVTWPRSARAADPRKDFLTADTVAYPDAGAFRSALREEMRLRKEKDVVIYVHGYNNTMAEGIYRVAQMHHDLKVPGIAIHYAWPSRGSALGYVYDRDSALFGRDGLEDLLNEVEQAGANKVLVVAHSMGAALTMETLRQVAIRRGSKILDRINGVMLISPDLDVDLFVAQARDMGKLPEPFLIFGNTRDTVLGISSRISGQPDRLGNLKDLAPLAGLNITYLDTAAYSEGAGHFNFGTSPALIQLLSGITYVDRAFRAEARVGLLPGVVLTVQNATKVVLAPVEAVVNAD